MLKLTKRYHKQKGGLIKKFGDLHSHLINKIDVEINNNPLTLKLQNKVRIVWRVWHDDELTAIGAICGWSLSDTSTPYFRVATKDNGVICKYIIPFNEIKDIKLIPEKEYKEFISIKS